MNLVFVINIVLLGVGLAMDAFSVSLANGLNERNMKTSKEILIASVYAFFQFIMPMIGWICVHCIVQLFTSIQKFIPWIALILLLYIGIKMIVEACICKKNSENEEPCNQELSFRVLLLQGIATSIDALSVGFAIEEYNLFMAIIASLIIAVVTYFICVLGLKIGKKAGQKLSNKASIFGGAILIIIGLEILIKSFF